MDPVFLAIETATKVCSVALFKGDDLLAIKESEREYSHAENITLFIDSLLKEAKLEMKDLSAVAISAGPGSYTGLRIGTAAAKALAYSLGIPLIAYDTLACLNAALNVKQKEKYDISAALIDARRDEVYIHLMDAQGNEIYPSNNLVLTEDALNEHFESKKIIAVGTGTTKFVEILKKHHIKVDLELFFSSKYAIRHIINKFNTADFEELAYFEPNYIKPFYTILRK